MKHFLNIALVAHDARKKELIEWVSHNASTLSRHQLFATGTTAKLLSEITYTVREHYEDGMIDAEYNLGITSLLSGSLGGDQQIGAMIAEGHIDILIFFCDNLITQGHQQDVGALTRLASLYNIGFATNRTTADMLITSPLIGDPNYEIQTPSAIDTYKNRTL